MKQRLLLSPLLLLPLVACGGEADPAAAKDAAYAALDSGDSKAAFEQFDGLLSAMDPSASDFVEVSVARLQAMGGTDGEKAAEEFLAFAKEKSLESKEYTTMASALTKAKAYTPAVSVLDAGVNAFPDQKDDYMKLIEALTKKAKQAGDAGALSALEGLGYLGGDE